MKRILLALAIGAFVLPLAAQPARSADVSIDFFYDNLSGGNWLELGDYGYCWQPDVTVSDPDWRPYTDGYWAYTDVGWTWISYEDFGWATYHYGRWIKLADYGWVWVPGSDLDWGPAWVSWRVGDDYIGWAPLPPRAPRVVYEGGPISGHVDIEFDIGPAYYNFVDVRYIGEPVLRSRIIDVHQNVTYINKTVNVTNITYKNNIVHDYGPDIHFVEQHSSRPIQRLHVQRQESADIRAAVKGGAVTKVQGQNLVVAAPLQIKKPAKPEAPPKIKARIAQPKLERGWAEVGNEQAQTELKQKIQSQDLHKIPQSTGGRPSVPEPMNPPGATKSERGTLGATPSPGRETGRRNLNSSKSNIYKSALPSPSKPSEESSKLKGEGANLKSGVPTPSDETTNAKHGGKHRENVGGSPSVPQPMNPAGATREMNQGKHRVQGTNVPSEQPAGGAHLGRREGGKKGEKGSPTPAP
jgi:hypothetical protein